MGVHKKSPNLAVMGDLGRYPLGIDVAANAIMYLKHLQNDAISDLLNEAVEMNSLSSKTRSWFYKTKELKEYVHQYSNRPSMSRKFIIKVLRSEYNAHWEKAVSVQEKLRTYRTFKHKFQPEPYLNFLHSKLRKSLARFRTSAHRLHVESGRYTRPPTPLDRRICPNCPDKVEDEFHFLIECPEYKNSRDIFMHEVMLLFPNFGLLDEKNKFRYLMIGEGRIIQMVSKFLFEHLK